MYGYVAHASMHTFQSDNDMHVQYSSNITLHMRGMTCMVFHSFSHVKFKKCLVYYYFHETTHVTFQNDMWYLLETCHYTRRSHGSSHIMGFHENQCWHVRKSRLVDNH